jgi:ABC-type amino acid transport substrate-binding protein
MVTTSARFGCLRGGGAGLLVRILAGVGISTLTPVADGAVLLVGPAALDARRLTGFDADSLSRVATLLPSEAAETVSSVITPALEPTSDQPNSLQAPVCQ